MSKSDNAIVNALKEPRAWWHEKVDSRIQLDMHSKCLIWTGTVTQTGYAMMSYHSDPIVVARLLWAKAGNPLPSAARGHGDGMILARRCRRFGCVSPRHHYLLPRYLANKRAKP